MIMLGAVAVLVLVMMAQGEPKDLKDILKGKIPVEYFRISTKKSGQVRGGLKTQKAEVKQFLKDYGITKSPVVFEEKISGGKGTDDRKEWANMINFILDKPRPSDYFIVMRDFTRWSRHTVYGPWAFKALYDAGVEMVSVQDRVATGTKHRADENGEFLFGLWIAIGARERSGVAQKTSGGLDVAAGLGRVGGARLDPSFPFKELFDYLPNLNAETGDPDKMFATEVSRKLRVGDTWVKKWTKNYNKWKTWGNAMGHPHILNEFLGQLNYLGDTLNKYGKNSKQYNAVAAQTSGFLKDPIRFYPFKRSQKDIAEYITNPDPYLPK